MRHVMKLALAGLALCILQPSNALAGPGGFEISVNPLFGFERTQKILPTPRTVTRFFYGALVTAGIPLLAAEAQFTRSTLEEVLSGTSVSSIGDRLKLGLRSNFRLGKLISLFVRAGAEASQETTTLTVLGVSSTNYGEIQYRPYAGAGFRVALTRKIYGTADVVAVFRDLNNLANTDLQATAGFSVQFP